MKTAFAFCAILAVWAVLAVPACAVEGDSLWSQTYGGPGSDGANCVIPASDGGYLLAGETGSFGAGQLDMYLVRVSSAGEFLWQRTYGSSDNDVAFCILPADSGDYFLAGYTATAVSYDVYVVKVNAAGDVLWSRTYGGSGIEVAYKIIPTLDGNYLLAGYTNTVGAGLYDMLLMKIDPSGNPLWTRTYGGYGYEEAKGVIQAQNGNILLAGYTMPWGTSDLNLYLVMASSSGDLIWSRSFGGSGNEEAYALASAPSGNFLAAGYSTSFGAGGGDMWLIQVSATGDSLWSRTYGGSGNDFAYAMTPSNDANFLLAGSTTSFGAGLQDMYLVKINSIGDTLWSRAYGGAQDEAANSAIQSGGDYLAAGWTNSFGSGGPDMWLLCAEGSAAPPDVTISLAPVNPPIEIPAGGGSFDYSVELANLETIPQTFAVWILVTLPGGSTYGPVLGPLTLTLSGSATVTRIRTQSVPGRAPAGNYSYSGFVGLYPNTIWDQTSFPFEKLPTGDGPWVNDWTGQGEPFDVRFSANEQTAPDAIALIGAYPNPFNPSTAIRYELRAAGPVNLKVYDTAGRSVATLVNGCRQAGTHEVTFDGAGLASGVYLYLLRASDFVASGKMVLLK